MEEIQTPAPQDVFFRGRSGDLRLGEWVMRAGKPPVPEKKKQTVALFGYPDDEGVKRNRGRPGAAGGPDSIRRHLYKMTLPADRNLEDTLALFDLGNIVVGPQLSDTHARAKTLAEQISGAGLTGIALGGGHDFAAPTFQGFRAASPKARWGLINVDPHLDTREMEGVTAHSGNPFRLLLESEKLRGQDFVEFGARTNRNTRSSWNYCIEKKVTILSLEFLRGKKSPMETLFNQSLTKLTKTCTAVGVTIDIDSCSDTEGSSAAPVVGFSTWELCRFASLAGKNSRVRYLEIAEVAPSLDSADRSSRIAAELIFAFLDSRSRLR